MNVAVENKIDELNRALHNVTMMQEQNQSALYRLERKEQSWEEINQNGSFLFDKLLSYWHEDRHMALLFEDNKQEFRQFQQQNKYAIEEEKEQLVADKRALINKEEAYYYERRKLMMDGEL
ncbi:DUF3958 family protein [Listeria welshimeri]|uniref:DUF3958 family protein n=1 Tax=Listeria welshimeri TaxID=1643 RepID=UPI0010B73BF6|nr:DUF3958 family protein [Listeria welshimeri]MBC1242807.1 DUF3958 family protein [Listeria welshimeri]MBC1630769.1 DUF3958 family protein [Listeria welshimeri]MBC1646909.1 DUF3958 family protein [Listeria welshimeri]MBC1694813.1 DUF3958 family protein [Listeria welshimeri]MBC1703564.1 DUF3958 family protein [Listeria welshimeri]